MPAGLSTGASAATPGGGRPRPASSALGVPPSSHAGPCRPGPGRGRPRLPASVGGGAVTLACPPLVSLEQELAGCGWGRALGGAHAVPPTLTPPHCSPCVVPLTSPPPGSGPGPSVHTRWAAAPRTPRGSDLLQGRVSPAARCVWSWAAGQEGFGPPAQKLGGRGGSPGGSPESVGRVAGRSLSHTGWAPRLPLHPRPRRPLPESAALPPEPHL